MADYDWVEGDASNDAAGKRFCRPCLKEFFLRHLGIPIKNRNADRRGRPCPCLCMRGLVRLGRLLTLRMRLSFGPLRALLVQ